jgi:hypothetical protein
LIPFGFGPRIAFSFFPFLSRVAAMTADANAEPKPPNSVWETIFTTTPVVLTVLATLLAALSNSEMTQAQYHRSLAAQYQSKVGDQWAFFQAKKIRGSGLENTADQLHPTGKIDAVQLKALAHQLTLALERAARDARKADETAGQPKPAAGADPAEQRSKTAVDLENRLTHEIDGPEGARALAFVSNDKVPEVEDQAFEDAAIDQALAAVREGASDDEINKLALKVKDEPLRKALSVAQENANRFDDAGKPIGKTLDHINEMVGEFAAIATNEGRDASPQSPNDDTKGAKEQEAATASEERARQIGERLHQSVVAARAQYNARRLRRDADYNYKIALLHEIQVHKSGATSDRHRDRSMHFFFGMLGAQAGVAISSMALAARRKSVLWGLAGLLGLAAVVFSGYVYLFR